MLTQTSRRVVAVLAVIVGALAVLVGQSSPASADPPIPLPNPTAYGITKVDWQQVDSSPATDWRQFDLTLTTSAIFRNGPKPNIKVRIFVPPNYSTQHSPYPTLYLLHGGTGEWKQFADNGAEDTVMNAGYPGIVVMPEGGSTGYYTDWYGHADNGVSPAWETFHIQQLLPWVDANFNTIRDRSGRSIAGASMGGFGALKYAGQHPDLFSAVASISGATNIRLQDAVTGGSANVPPTVSQHMQWSGACIMSFYSQPWLNSCADGAYKVNLYENGFPVQDDARQAAYRMQTLWGPESNYPNVNPWDMASRFAGYGTNGNKVALYSGGRTAGEKDMYAHLKSFYQRVTSLGQQPHVCVGDGNHADWTLWRADLTDFIHLVDGTPITCHRGYTVPT
jgi:S-formylglutathione hydrolase FrmB